MDLLDTVRQTIEAHHMFAQGDTVVMGVSGGPDSLCLLHALRQLRTEMRIDLHLAHLDHGIRGAESQADAVYVEELARAWDIPATLKYGDVPAYAKQHKLAIEEAARRARYLFLGRVAQQVGASCVAVGHNADDQVETILMHWMRGSGLGGLRGMLPVQVLGAEAWWSGPVLRLARPLLDVPRVEVEAYCRQQGLEPRFDRSNLDLTHFRNRIRHELVPYLERFNPRIREVLRRSSRVITDDHDYLHQEGQRAWGRLAEVGDGAITVPLEPWSQLHPSLQRQLLREAIHRLRRSLRDITWAHVEQARVGLDEISAGSKITLPQGLFLFKGYDEFVIGEEIPSPDLPLLTKGPLTLKVPGTTQLPDSSWRLHAETLEMDLVPGEALDNPDPWRAYLDLKRAGTDLKLRGRQSGDRFQPLGMGGRSKTLNAFLTDAKVPLHIRDSLPIVVSPRHVLWVTGYRIDECVKITNQTHQVLHLRFVEAD